MNYFEQIFVGGSMLTLCLGCGTVGTDDGSDTGSQGTQGTQGTQGSADLADDTAGVPGGRRPYRDEWSIEADLDFIHVDPGTGVTMIANLVIGGQETNDNFANRGDVIVNFDGPADRITVELRRFTMADSPEQAEERFNDLSLWAYDAAIGRPADQDPADDCVASGWRNGCEVRVYFDGLNQLGHSGADIRVTLPPDYRQRLSVFTEDNIEDDDYFNRGDVCISNLHASANIEMQSGNAWVSLASDATPAPKCTSEQIQACENWMSDGVPTPWAPECDCIAVGGGEFGLLVVGNGDGESSDVTIDAPAGLWTTVRAENRGEGQDPAGDHCEANISIPGVSLDPVGNDFPWEAKGSVNFPGQPAIIGAGYTIQVSSLVCGPVAHTPDPESYVGEGNGAMQASEERGNLEVCTGCIVQACDELIP